MRIPMFRYKIAALTGEVSQPHRKPVLSNSFGCLLASEREGGGGYAEVPNLISCEERVPMYM